MFKLPELPFADNALEPLMSRDTLQTHHGKHHAAYIKKMNDALASRSDAPASLEEVVRLAAREKNTGLFNNSAQAWNHAFFWNSLTPNQSAAPSDALKRAIEQSYGSMDQFKQDFVAKGLGHFASGWVWLMADSDGKVQLDDTHDAATPMLDGRTTPLFTCDVWEHAYYIDFKNDRGGFLEGFIGKLINWEFASAQYEAAKGSAQGWTFPT